MPSNASLRTYIRTVCPPRKMPTSDDFAWDPYRAMFRDRALNELYDGRPVEFRRWLSTQPSADTSPTARFLLGLAHFYEGDLDEAECCYRDAIKSWDDQYARGRGPLRDPDAAMIQCAVTTNLVLIYRAREDARAARDLVRGRLSEMRRRRDVDGLAGATGSLWIQLFCLACDPPDECELEAAFDLLGRSPRAWREHAELWRRLAKHAELTFLREHSAWRSRVDALEPGLRDQILELTRGEPVRPIDEDAGHRDQEASEVNCASV